ncbi:hypothetical protein [Sinomicrobium sp. M5D2P9]
MKKKRIDRTRKKRGISKKNPSKCGERNPIEQIIPLLQFLERVMGEKDEDMSLKNDDLWDL